MSEIPPLCPSLTKWLNAVSVADDKPIGAGGPNAHVLTPAKACMTNRMVVCELLARAGFTPTPDEYGKFDGPLGLTGTDFVSLREALAYIEGHADANGLTGDELQRYFEAEILPPLHEIRARWAEQYPDLFAEKESDDEIHN